MLCVVFVAVVVVCCGDVHCVFEPACLPSAPISNDNSATAPLTARARVVAAAAAAAAAARQERADRAGGRAARRRCSRCRRGGKAQLGGGAAARVLAVLLLALVLLLRWRARPVRQARAARKRRRRRAASERAGRGPPPCRLEPMGTHISPLTSPSQGPGARRFSGCEMQGSKTLAGAADVASRWIERGAWRAQNKTPIS